MSRLEAAWDALERKIADIESDVVGWEAERDELALRIADAEREAAKLQRALDKLSDLDEDQVEDVLAGELVQKSPRMQELEQISMRGRSWSEWQAINDEYRREAEHQRQTLADLLEGALL